MKESVGKSFDKAQECACTKKGRECCLVYMTQTHDKITKIMKGLASYR